jgi:CHRD domain-containing protein
MVAYKASGQTKSGRAQRRRTYRQLVWSLLTVVVCAGSLVILSCGGDDDDTEQLSANLTGAQEVPPVTTTSATGTATLDINDDRTQIDFTLNVSTALSGNIREAHIHIGPPGVNGPIVLDFCTTSLVTPPANVPTPPTCPTPPFTLSGTLTAANLRTITPAIQGAGVNTFADAVTQILNGNAYANVHTTTFTGGEIRGQLGRQ